MSLTEEFGFNTDILNQCKVTEDDNFSYFEHTPYYKSKRHKEGNKYFPPGKKIEYFIPGTISDVVICEGQTDAVALKHLYPEINVYCICGTPSYHLIHNIRSYGLISSLNKAKLILCLDNDTPGKECANNILYEFKNSTLKDHFRLGLMKFPEKYNDVADLWKNERSKDNIQVGLFNDYDTSVSYPKTFEKKETTFLDNFNKNMGDNMLDNCWNTLPRGITNVLFLSDEFKEKEYEFREGVNRKAWVCNKAIINTNNEAAKIVQDGLYPLGLSPTAYKSLAVYCKAMNIGSIVNKEFTYESKYNNSYNWKICKADNFCHNPATSVNSCQELSKADKIRYDCKKKEVNNYSNNKKETYLKLIKDIETEKRTELGHIERRDLARYMLSYMHKSKNEVSEFFSKFKKYNRNTTNAQINSIIGFLKSKGWFLKNDRLYQMK